MSADYYARLEQGRGPQPSAALLTALARALRLTIDERDLIVYSPVPGTAAVSQLELLAVLGQESFTP